MKLHLNNVLEELFAGNLFPADIKPMQEKAKNLHLKQIETFGNTLTKEQKAEFFKLMDEISLIQSHSEEAFFQYGCEFASAFLLRMLLSDETHNIMLEKNEP